MDNPWKNLVILWQQVSRYTVVARKDEYKIKENAI